MNSTTQYGRACSLVVFGLNQNGLDLSELRIKFAIKRANTLTPNTADIRVYNVSIETARTIKKEFSQVILQAGYVGNYGVIFRGNIKQVILGRENSTDTFVDIIAGDGDLAYNFAVVNASLASGSKQEQQLSAVMNSMMMKGVMPGYVQLNSNEELPRGKVLYGNSINYLRTIAETTEQQVSIQDEQITFVPLSSFLPGEVTVLTSKTGIVGTPQQTNEGVNLKCLLNPTLKVGGRVQIDNKSVEALKINLAVPNSAANIPAPFSEDGVYNIFVVEHIGDTRGLEWYSNLVTLYVDVTSNPANSVTGAG